MKNYAHPSPTLPSSSRHPLAHHLLTRRMFLRRSGVVVWGALLTACAGDGTPAAIEASGTGAGNASTVVAPQSVATPEAASAITASQELPAQAHEFAQVSIQLVNQARAEAGLEPLAENPVLADVAQRYSERMANEDFYGHEDPAGQDVTDRLIDAGYLAQMSAENIAAGQPDPETVVEGWLDSPGHRVNIMNPDLREIGAGYAHTERPPYFHYWTHVFATPDASAGRDRNLYPELLLTQLNELRGQAGVAPLTGDATLTEIATTHLEALIQSPAFESQVDQSLEAASQEALQAFQQTLALTAAGPATPEDAIAKWVEDDVNNNLMDAGLRAAGVAYLFVEQDEYRHYWFVSLGG